MSSTRPSWPSRYSVAGSGSSRDVAEASRSSAARAAAVELRERAADEPLPQVAGRCSPLIASRRVGRDPRLASVCEARATARTAGEPRAVDRLRGAAPERRATCRRSLRRGACGSRRAARRRPGRRARPSRAGRRAPESARKPRDERSASGSSRCQTSSARSTVCSANESSSSWWSVPKCSATKRASASSLPSPASAKPTENVFTGSVICLRHQRDDHARVEPAAQHRPERHVAHQPQPDRLLELRQQPLGARRRGWPSAGVRLRDTPSSARTRTRGRDRRSGDGPASSFVTPASGVSGAGNEAERQDRRRSPRSRARVRRARSRAGSSARRRRRADRRPTA